VPLTVQAMGKILRPALSGIALIEGAYTVRVHRRISADFSGAYYFRTDKITYRNTEVDIHSPSPLLGAEIYGGLNWSPFSDVLFNAGGGVFFPQTGKVFKDGAGIKYRITLEASVSF
jgi:hypothetical protein